MRLLATACCVANLACAGSAEPPVAGPAGGAAAAVRDGWIDGAVEEALAWEVQPGTTAEPDDGTRAAALRAFFAAHPEYADPARRQALAAHACGLGTEAAHAWLAAPPPRAPLVVEVAADAWEVFVAHADVHCTSDDWGWYAAEAAEAAGARGAVTGYGSPEHDVVVVRRAGVEVARAPLTGQGYLLLAAGAAAAALDYAPTPELLDDLDAYFGPPVPSAAD